MKRYLLIAAIAISPFWGLSQNEGPEDDSLATEQPKETKAEDTWDLGIDGTTNMKDSEVIAQKISGKLDSLLALTELERIGRFQLYAFNPTVYKLNIPIGNVRGGKIRKQEKENNKKKEQTDSSSSVRSTPVKIDTGIHIKVDSVEFNVSEGLIENIRVYATDLGTKGVRIFENLAPIPLNNMDLVAEYRFLFDVRNRNLFLKLNDFLFFLPKPGQSYVPDDGTFGLSNRVTKAELRASVDLNSNLDIKVYTDALSLLGKSGNGLVQTDISTKIILSTIPMKTIPSLTWWHSLEANLKYSKFDSKYEAVQMHSYSRPMFTTTRELLTMNQLSYLNLGIKLAVLHLKSFGHSFDVNLGLQYDFVDVQLQLSDEKIPSNMFSWFGEYKGTLAKSKYLGLDVSFKLQGQKVMNTGTDFDFSNNELYYVPEFTAYFKPKGNVSNRLFMRFRSFTSSWFSESYSTLQIGYGAKLSYRKRG